MTETLVATRSIVVERTLLHPPERIWRALAQATHGFRAMGGGWPRIVERLGEIAGGLAA